MTEKKLDLIRRKAFGESTSGILVVEENRCEGAQRCIYKQVHGHEYSPLVLIKPWLQSVSSRCRRFIQDRRALNCTFPLTLHCNIFDYFRLLIISILFLFCFLFFVFCFLTK